MREGIFSEASVCLFTGGNGKGMCPGPAWGRGYPDQVTLGTLTRYPSAPSPWLEIKSSNPFLSRAEKHQTVFEGITDRALRELHVYRLASPGGHLAVLQSRVHGAILDQDGEGDATGAKEGEDGQIIRHLFLVSGKQHSNCRRYLTLFNFIYLTLFNFIIFYRN